MEKTKEQMREANVICVVYAVNNVDSRENLRRRWLDVIVHELNLSVPILLIGNKVDLRSQDRTQEELKAEMDPIIDQYPTVETVLECSAKTIFNVDEAFEFATQAVLHPMQPLYDVQRATFKPAAILAFERIFRLCDINYDGFWDDAELNRFQTRCYPAEGPLDASAITNLKNLIKELEPQGVDPARGITVKGLVALQHALVNRGKMITVWAGLRAFGYSDDLNLPEEFVKLPVGLSAPRVSDAVEISAHGRSFVVSLFGNCTRVSRATNSSSPSCTFADVHSLFSIIPEGKIFLEEHLGFPTSLPLVSQPDGTKVLDRKSWDALWALMSLVDPQRTYQYLNLLGYEPPQGVKRTETLMQLASVAPENKGQPTTAKERTSFMCYVVGARSVGKSSLLRKFVDSAAPSSSSLSPEFSVNSVGQDWLVLRTFGAEEKSVLESDEAVDRADSIAVCFDVSDATSLTYATQVVDSLQRRFPELPLSLIATKVDSPSTLKSPTVANARRFARSHRIELTFTSVVKDNTSNLWAELLRASKRRRSASSRKSTSSASFGKTLVTALATLVAAGALSYVGLEAYRRGLFDKLPGFSSETASKK